MCVNLFHSLSLSFFLSLSLSLSTALALFSLFLNNMQAKDEGTTDSLTGNYELRWIICFYNLVSIMPFFFNFSFFCRLHLGKRKPHVLWIAMCILNDHETIIHVCLTRRLSPSRFSFLQLYSWFFSPQGCLAIAGAGASRLWAYPGRPHPEAGLVACE